MSNPNPRKRINGAKIIHYRWNKFMSQIECAEGICSVEMLKQIEANQAIPSPQVIEKIASKLGVPIEALEFDGEGESTCNT